jgi:hypothetical protein
MFEEIHELDLIEGELYLIINPVFEIRIEKATMICYTRTRDQTYYGIQYDSDSDGLDTIILESTIFYRYVSIEEYKQKVREKYNNTCLDIVLKRLVDESFVW